MNEVNERLVNKSPKLKIPKGVETNPINISLFNKFNESLQAQTLSIYKFIVALFLIINGALLTFIIVYKIQIRAIQSDSNNVSNKIVSIKDLSESYGRWTESMLINWFFSSKVDSELISEVFKSKKELDTILQWANISIDKHNINLCFKSTKDRESSDVFHRYCKSSSKLLVIVETTNETRFGGYISNFQDKEIIQDENAFMFNLDTMQKFDIRNKENAFVLFTNGFFSFGKEDFILGNGFLDSKSFVGFPKDYGNSIDKVEDLIGSEVDSKLLSIKQIEVFIIL